MITQGLIQWSDSSLDEATWEDLDSLKQQFLVPQLGVKPFLNGWGMPANLKEATLKMQFRALHLKMTLSTTAIQVQLLGNSSKDFPVACKPKLGPLIGCNV